MNSLPQKIFCAGHLPSLKAFYGVFVYYFTMIHARLISLSKVNSDDNYNAFTGLVYYGGHYRISYRTGKAHGSPDGSIIVVRSKNGIEWEQVAHISNSEVDLRDPRLLVYENRLILYYFSLNYYDPLRNKFEPANSYIQEWNCEKNEFSIIKSIEYSRYKVILWTIANCDQIFYFAGYESEMGHHKASLFRAKSLSDDWELVFTIPENQLPPDGGYNEFDIVAKSSGEMTLFCRVDKDNLGRIKGKLNLQVYYDRLKQRKQLKTGSKGSIKKIKDLFRSKISKNSSSNLISVATANAPYQNWQISTIPLQLKGPRAIEYDNGFLFVGRNVCSNKTRKINLYYYRSGIFNKILKLATGKDGSYAGLIRDPQNSTQICISFYSDHERITTPMEGKSNDIWFARVEISEN